MTSEAAHEFAHAEAEKRLRRYTKVERLVYVLVAAALVLGYGLAIFVAIETLDRQDQQRRADCVAVLEAKVQGAAAEALHAAPDSAARFEAADRMYAYAQRLKNLDEAC